MKKIFIGVLIGIGMMSLLGFLPGSKESRIYSNGFYHGVFFGFNINDDEKTIKNRSDVKIGAVLDAIKSFESVSNEMIKNGCIDSIDGYVREVALAKKKLGIK